jgi:ssDNA-specific exonuclease RecJ
MIFIKFKFNKSNYLILQVRIDIFKNFFRILLEINRKFEIKKCIFDFV